MDAPLKALIPFTTIVVALVGVAACDSKDESRLRHSPESKADVLEHEDHVRRKSEKVDAADSKGKALLDPNAPKAPVPVNQQASAPSPSNVGR